MSIELTELKMRIGFNYQGIHYYKHNNKFYKAKNPSDKQIQITKKHFIEIYKKQKER